VTPVSGMSRALPAIITSLQTDQRCEASAEQLGERRAGADRRTKARSIKMPNKAITANVPINPNSSPMAA